MADAAGAARDPARPRQVRRPRKQARATSLAATEKLPSFDRPVLVVWATEDRLMPREHGRRLADIFPQGRLIEIADSYTLITEDQPAELTRHIREFLVET